MSANGGPTSAALPLARAAERLRRQPGRPRKPDAAPRVETGGAPGALPTLRPVMPRLLDAESAARYLGVSAWTVRDLEAGGHLPRVRLPLPGGKDLRKLLYDRADLDRLIDRAKDPAEH